jgi:two-component sensor histidine kinase
MTDIEDLRQLQDRQLVMMAELQHRTRNVLAVVQAIARKTFRSTGSRDDFIEEFENRLSALSRVQGLLARVEHQQVELRTLVETELEARSGRHADAGRVRLDGPQVVLSALPAQTLALAIHELVTNAIKYGALKVPHGRLLVTWYVDPGQSPPKVTLDWSESGVAIPQKPTRQGYGSELIARALPRQLQTETELTFTPDGVRCLISLPVSIFPPDSQLGQS